jgi:cell wall-associated NlpC family hydrolase
MIGHKKLIFFIVMLPTFLLSIPNNVFIIKDKDGKVIKGKRVTHVKNSYFDEDKSLKEMNNILSELNKLSKTKKANDFIKEQNKLISKIDSLEDKRESLTKSALDYNKENILKNAKKHLGEDYVWGGTNPGGFDCSGYMQYIYKKEGVSIPRTANQQSKVGKEVSRFELKKGDLLFFLTDKSRNIPVTHVGMYLGDDKFIHAASKRKGIIISSFNKSRYSKLFVKATRIIK